MGKSSSMSLSLQILYRTEIFAEGVQLRHQGISIKERFHTSQVKSGAGHVKVVSEIQCNQSITKN